ncbi:hypothetical protein KAI92_04480 [Candidatus Parcubacteria bacterium]|nr:hypothetical protein [Candidatus Parcubacteria bacterium]
MKKYRQAALILAILTFVLTTGVSTAYANSSEYEQLRKCSDLAEKRILILEAFEKKDYKLWKKIIGNNPISEVVTVDMFEKFIDARELARNGNYNKSFNLSCELGNDLENTFRQIAINNNNLFEQVYKIIDEK